MKKKNNKAIISILVAVIIVAMFFYVNYNNELVSNVDTNQNLEDTTKSLLENASEEDMKDTIASVENASEIELLENIATSSTVLKEETLETIKQGAEYFEDIEQEETTTSSNTTTSTYTYLDYFKEFGIDATNMTDIEKGKAMCDLASNEATSEKASTIENNLYKTNYKEWEKLNNFLGAYMVSLDTKGYFMKSIYDDELYYSWEEYDEKERVKRESRLQSLEDSGWVAKMSSMAHEMVEAGYLISSSED